MATLYPSKHTLIYRSIQAGKLTKAKEMHARWIGDQEGGFFLIMETPPPGWEGEWPPHLAKTKTMQGKGTKIRGVSIHDKQTAHGALSIDPYRSWQGMTLRVMDLIHRHIVFMFPKYWWHFHYDHDQGFYTKKGTLNQWLRPTRTSLKTGTPCRPAWEGQIIMYERMIWRITRGKHMTRENNQMAVAWEHSPDLTRVMAKAARALRKGVPKLGKGTSGTKKRSSLRLRTSCAPRLEALLRAIICRPPS